MGGTSLIHVLLSVEYGESRLLEGICFLCENHLYCYYKPKDYTEMEIGQQGGCWETERNAKCMVHVSEVMNMGRGEPGLTILPENLFTPIFFPPNKFSFIFFHSELFTGEKPVLSVF